MNEDQARELILKTLAMSLPRWTRRRSIRDFPFQEQLDLDSMDFLNHVTGLEEAAGIRIPEPHYRRISTLSGCVAYMLAAAPVPLEGALGRTLTAVGPGREGSTDPTTLRPVLRGCG
jgi:acyl carrier protein